MANAAPVELTTFVGRRQDLAEGRRMVRDTRLVTLVGPGGVGKTRLAGRLAQQVHRLFPDGVVWVELASQRDPLGVASEIAAALGIEARDQSVLDAVTTYLRPRELLLVLDNCEHLVDECAGIVTHLLQATSRTHVLSTSRQPLRTSGEHLMCLEPLPVPTFEEAASGTIGHIESVALLTDRARAQDSSFRVGPDNAELVSRLVRRVDGIPLAIELTAARLRAFSMSQLVERLDHRFEVLTTGSRAAIPRHQTLRGLIGWSYDLCSAAERDLWAGLAVFDGGADLDAIEAVCDRPGLDVVEALAGLVDKSVVTVGRDRGAVRYEMLETIREYGLERLAESGAADDVRTRHRDHFLAWAQRSAADWFGPDQASRNLRVLLEMGNLRAAFDLSVTRPDDRPLALELLVALATFWPTLGMLHEARRWFARALPEDLEPSVLTLRALADAAWLSANAHEREDAAAWARRALSVELGDDIPEVRASRARASAVLRSIEGDRPAAIALHEQAAREYDALADRERQSAHLGTLSFFLGAEGRPEEALLHADQALRLSDAYSERAERDAILAIRGSLLWQTGRLTDALESVRVSLEVPPDQPTVPAVNSLEFAARIFGSLGEHHRAAMLRGALHQVMEDIHYSLSRNFVPDADANESSLRAALGDAAFEAAFADGRRLSLAEAIELVHAPDASTTAPSRAAAGDAQLSRREQEVADLVAAGLSNKEIAARLVISARTVEGHVAKVMDKLGAHSRAAVAAWVSGHRSPGDG